MSKVKHIEISGRKIGPGYPAFIVAELSANHRQEYAEAEKLLRAAKETGADAVKVQTYTADTLTIPSRREEFLIKGGTPWDGMTLYELYAGACMPWEWQPKLKKRAEELGIIFFSTPFDRTAADFLEEIDVPAYKIASFEIVDTPLVEYVARKGKPVLISTGMASREEIEEAVRTARNAGNNKLALLKCVSAYPAPPEDMNLRTIPHLSRTFGVPAGLSDHTLGTAAAVAGVSLGACIVEKHFTLSRKEPSPDSAFSLEPGEFREMVTAVRTAEKALGKVSYRVTEPEKKSRVFRRSLFVVKDMKTGDVFTEENVRSIRPGYGLPPRHIKEIMGRKAALDIPCGSPLRREMVE